MLFWRLVNPLNRPLAGIAPWWILLETTGRVSGQPRRTALARGPTDSDGTWVISVHGNEAQWLRNIWANPVVRLRLHGRWRDGRASVHVYDAAIVDAFNAYARGGPRLMGIEPLLVRITLT